MSRAGRRAALLARFKAGSQTRVADCDALLGKSPPWAEADLATLRAELHTLKGESRMLGLTSMATLTHDIEDALDELGTTPSEAAQSLLRAALATVGAMLEAPLEEGPAAADQLSAGQLLLAQLREQLGRDEDEAQLEATEDGGEDAGGGDQPEAEGATRESSEPERDAAEPEKTTAEPEPKPRRPSTTSSFTMVATTTVDELCERAEALRMGLAGLRGQLDLGQRESLELAQVQRELEELAEMSWGLRLVNVEPALRELSTHAGELAEQLDKQVQIRVDAGDAQLERSLLERLEQPLLHLVRNALDHGIEDAGERGDKPAMATLEIAARAVGAEVELTLADDGRGIDLDRVRERAVERGFVEAGAAAQLPKAELLSMLFESGFSTAASVTELSGRGVGLDVVRRIVEGLGGSVGVNSELGRGTRFEVRVPARVSRERVLVLGLGSALWGLPSRRVERVLRLREVLADGAEESSGRAVAVRIDGCYLPLLSLSRLLGVDDIDEAEVLMCEHAGRSWAIASPSLVGEFELFRRPVGPTLASVSPASATAVLDDGRLVLLVEPASLLGRHERAGGRFSTGASTPRRARVLVVDDSPIIRELMQELLANAGLEVRVAENGEQALSVLEGYDADLVLSDVEMPKVDGFSLLARIRERDAELPVIMVTTRGSAADRRRASELGADAYLIKSAFEQEDLLRTVSRFVEVSS